MLARSSPSVGLFSLLFIALACGHIRWVHPTPRSQTAGKSYPCPDPFFGAGQQVNTIAPGLFQLQWEEFVNHPNTPFRIALSVGDDSNYDNWILVDHLPHMGYSGGSAMFYYNITIPDINCPKCSLQLINPMTDKISQGTCCSYPVKKDVDLCLSVYHSCANLIITGTQDPMTYQHQNVQTSPIYRRETTVWNTIGPLAFSLPGNYTVTLSPETCQSTPPSTVTKGTTIGSTSAVNTQPNDNSTGSGSVAAIVILCLFLVISVGAAVGGVIYWLRKKRVQKKKSFFEFTDENEMT